MYQRLQCRDNYFFKIKFAFFLYLRLSASKGNDLPLCIYFWYNRQWGTEHHYLLSRFLGVSILLLLIIYRIYDYKHRKLSAKGFRRQDTKKTNVVGINMIRNNRIEQGCPCHGICFITSSFIKRLSWLVLHRKLNYFSSSNEKHLHYIYYLTLLVYDAKVININCANVILLSHTSIEIYDYDWDVHVVLTKRNGREKKAYIPCSYQ